MSSIPTFRDPKDPSDDCDYFIDWSGVEPLSGSPADRIVSVDSVEITPDGSPSLSEQTDRRSFTDTTTTLWFTGGEAGTTYEVTVTVSTAGLRIFQRSVKIKVRER